MMTEVMGLENQAPNNYELHAAIEALLFAAGDPVSISKLCRTLEIDRKAAREALRELADYYLQERRGIRLARMEDHYQLCTAPEYADAIRAALEYRKPYSFTRPSLEVLAIIAHFQPATRSYIDQIRGVDSSSILSFLLDRGLIEKCGHVDAPGNPLLYRTTLAFLREFHLESLDELPELPSMSPQFENQSGNGQQLDDLMDFVDGNINSQVDGSPDSDAEVGRTE